MKKLIPFAIGLALSTTTLTAANSKYDCTASETAAYIKVNTASLQMPTGVSKPKDFTAALISAKEKENEGKSDEEKEESCMNIWSGDLDLNDEWEKIKEKMDNLSFDFSFSGEGGIMDKIRKAIKDEYDGMMEKIMEEYNKGICERFNEIDWKSVGDKSNEYFGGKMKSKYGFNPNDERWWETPLKKEMNGEMDNLGDYVFDPDELEEDINSETRKKIKEKDDDFWDDL